MPRQADKIFLRIATQKGYLQEQDADDLWAELTRLEAAGSATKARKLAVEFGFMDAGLAKTVKHEVREFLTDKVREESQQSRSQRRIAGFELFERLGSGAMGSVYKARHCRLNKIVAIKLLNPDFADDEKYVARFLLEARAAASMNHPNVVQAYDVGQAGAVHYIAMEFVDGKTVKELIQRRGKLDEAASIEIVIQILGALQHAHESNLIHRDVKPANLMITPDGQAKLLDLGLARRTDVENGLTGEGKAIGTPYFMAPEQALDKGADFRADIYALGGTLFNMVTGDKPYKAKTPVAVMNKHLKAPIPDASKINPEVSTGLARVIKKMLAKRPADRYQSHENLVADLEAVLSGFMPELKTGKAAAGISYIQPRAGAVSRDPARSRERFVAGGGFGKLQIGLAAAACLLVVVAVFFGSRTNTDVPTDVANEEVREDDASSKEPKGSERSAQALYDELTQGENWRRVEELEEFVKSYKGTKVARRARTEAKRLRSKLSTREEKRFGSRREELDSLAGRGDLHDALEGYQALSTQMEDEQLRKVANERAEELTGVIDRRLKRMEQEAEGMVNEGREREAAEILRKSARLQPKGNRGKTLAKAEQLDRKADGRSAGARASAKKARSAEDKSDAELIEDLPGKLAEHVRVDELQEAFELAKSTAKKLTTPRAKADVRHHVEALEAASRLKELAIEGFAQRKNTAVTLERRSGTNTIEGKLLAAAGDKLTVALSKVSGAEIIVSLDDLAEEEVWRAVRKLMGTKSREYLVGVTAIKLYREDADAAEYLARCTEEGFDLTPIVKALAATKPEPVVASLPAGSSKEPKSSVEDEREKFKRALARNRSERWMISNRLRLFPEADDVGYERGRLEPAYNFQDNQNFKKEWKLESGKSRPARSMERTGLILEGKGRAEFFAPLSGDLAMKVRFRSQMFDSRYGRFAITLDGEKHQRISCEMGQILYTIKGKLRASEGKNQASEVRTQTNNVLELIKTGDELITKFNGAVIGETTLKSDLGTYKLGLEWNRAAIDLTRIRTLLSPRPEWVERVVGKQPADGS